MRQTKERIDNYNTIKVEDINPGGDAKLKMETEQFLGMSKQAQHETTTLVIHPSLFGVKEELRSTDNTIVNTKL